MDGTRYLDKVYVGGFVADWTSVNSADLAAMGITDPMSYFFGDNFDFIQVQGSSNNGVYDPSPEDGVFGLDIEDKEFGSNSIRYTWTSEVDGYFDLNENGIYDIGDSFVTRGTSVTTDVPYDLEEYSDWALSTFTPLSFDGMV